MFYEIVYETGAHSVAEYATDEEAVDALKAHHERALAGEVGGPSEHSAERIKCVFVYNQHPADFGASQAMHSDVVRAELDALIGSLEDENGIVAVPDLASAVRDLTNPIVISGPHESNFKKKEERTLDPKKWEKE